MHECASARPERAQSSEAIPQGFLRFLSCFSNAVEVSLDFSILFYVPESLRLCLFKPVGLGAASFPLKVPFDFKDLSTSFGSNYPSRPCDEEGKPRGTIDLLVEVCTLSLPTL